MPGKRHQPEEIIQHLRTRAPLAAPEDGKKSRSQILPAASREHSRASPASREGL